MAGGALSFCQSQLTAKKQMSDSDKRITCDTHGAADATFLCQHLAGGERLGFYIGYDSDNPDALYPDAWCGGCDKVRQAEGGWNDKSEKFAGIKLLCAHCYEAARDRNWLQNDA